MKITKVEVFRLPTANSKQNSPHRMPDPYGRRHLW